MAGDPMSPEVLVSVPNEVEAAAIVGALAEQGIRARAVGGYTSGFRAEAPGDVKVVVGRADLARAAAILAEIQSEPIEVDWSKVDVGDGLPPTEADEDAAPTREAPRLQFSIASLLTVQTVASVILAAWKSLQGRVSFVVAFAVTYLAFMAVMPILITLGTVGIAADLNRARQAWRYVGRALCVGVAVVAACFVFARLAVALGVRL
jgi:hypothetical protein